MTPSNMPPVLTVDEAAQWLRTSPSAVRRYIATHQLAGVRIGKFVRVTADALLDFVATRPLTVRTSKKHFNRCRDGAKSRGAGSESAR